MSSRSLVICDKEEGYATALATYLTKQKEFAFQIQVCNEPVKLTEMQKQQKIDILLINEMYCKVKNKELTAGKILILTEHYIQDPKQRRENYISISLEKHCWHRSLIFLRRMEKEGFYLIGKHWGRKRLLGFFRRFIGVGRRVMRWSLEKRWQYPTGCFIWGWKYMVEGVGIFR